MDNKFLERFTKELQTHINTSDEGVEQLLKTAEKLNIKVTKKNKNLLTIPPSNLL